MNHLTSPQQWGEMRPLTLQRGTLDTFPVYELPPIIADYVMAVAESTQTTPDMASVVALGVLAVCNQRKYQVWNNYFEPLNLYTVLVAEPGERKSAVVQHFTKHLQEFQRQENKMRKEEINCYKIRKEMLENELKQLKESKKQPTDLEKQLIQKTTALEDLAEVKPLRLFCDDCTPEAFVGLLERNNGMMSVISAEGGIFDIMAGRYNAVPNLDVFLKGHTGEEIIVDRKHSGTLTVSNPTLTFVLAIQPHILEKIMRNPALEGRGLLARFLYSVPVSMIGTRSYDSNPVPYEIEGKYKELLHKLLSTPIPEVPTVLTLSPSAQNVMKSYFEQIETMLQKEQSIKNWLAKHIGSVHRIAGNLHLAGQEGGEISEQTVKSAIEIGKYFGSHARYSFLTATSEEELIKAKEVLELAYKLSKTATVTRRELYRQGGKRNLQKVEELVPILDLLEDYGYIKQVHEPLSPTATRPSDIIHLNPNYRP
ncbi:MAG: YfjI family protein [Eubacteriales bacterium]